MKKKIIISFWVLLLYEYIFGKHTYTKAEPRQAERLDIMVLPVWMEKSMLYTYPIILLAALILICRYRRKSKLLSASERKNNFFHDLAMEIKVPLTLITSPIYDLLAITKEIPKAQKKLVRMQKITSKLLHIGHELVDHKNNASLARSPNIRRIHFKSYVEDLFTLFTDIAQQREVQFYIKEMDDPGQLEIDTRELDNALLHCILHSIKRLKANGKVFLSSEINEGNYILKIADIGKQKSAALNHTYTEQTISTSEDEGVSIAENIIQKHGGKLSRVSIEYSGKQFTQFKIVLPLSLFQRTTKPRVPEKDKSQNVPSDKELHARQVMMLVNANEKCDHLPSMMKEHYRTIIVHDEQVGVDMAKEILPDLIVIDATACTNNGYHFCKKLKANIATAQIPVILITPDMKESNVVEALQHGANLHVQKPLNTEVFLLQVRNLLSLTRKDKKSEMGFMMSDQKKKDDEKFLKHLEEIIESNLANNFFSVDFLAEKMSISQHLLYKRLKEITGLSANNFIKNYRFEKAKHMLQFSNNVADIAYAVGFADRKYFSREFKKHFGYNPSEIHRQMKTRWRAGIDDDQVRSRPRSSDKG